MITEKVISLILEAQRSAIESGNPPFAAVIIVGDEVISRSYNTSRSSGNPLEHAEISAIRAAIENRGSEILRTAHLVSSNEPCPMCIGACIWSGIKEVSYFVSQEDVAAIRGWGKFMPARQIAAADDSGIKVNGPMENEAMKTMHREFWTTGGNAKFKHSIHLSENTANSHP